MRARRIGYVAAPPAPQVGRLNVAEMAGSRAPFSAAAGENYSEVMGGIWFRGREFITSLSETVGYKTGLAIDEERLRTIVHEAGYGESWPKDDDAVLRIRSEEFEELFARVLHRLGASAPDRAISPIAEVYPLHQRRPREEGRLRCGRPRVCDLSQ